MNAEWSDHRKGYRYAGFLFSEDGEMAKEAAIEYREQAFAKFAAKRFRIWLSIVLLCIFPGIPLLSYLGFQDHLIWIGVLWCGIAWWTHRRIHHCPGCGGPTRTITTPHMNSPVLYLCKHCRTYFEHGQMDGGWPWK